MKITSNGKTLNYRIVDLVESYNFHIKFTSIRVHAKKLQFFERKLKTEIKLRSR
jgi:transposase